MFSLTNILLGMLMTTMWVVGACVIRSACSTMRMPGPGFTAAMMLTLLAGAGAVATQFALGVMTGMSAFGFVMDQPAAEHLRMMLAAPVWMLVCAMVYKSMLPTTFGKATIIFMSQALVIAAMVVGFSLLANVTHSATLMQVRSMMPF